MQRSNVEERFTTNVRSNWQSNYEVRRLKIKVTTGTEKGERISRRPIGTALACFSLDTQTLALSIYTPAAIYRT